MLVALSSRQDTNKPPPFHPFHCFASSPRPSIALPALHCGHCPPLILPPPTQRNEMHHRRCDVVPRPWYLKYLPNPSQKPRIRKKPPLPLFPPPSPVRCNSSQAGILPPRPKPITIATCSRSPSIPPLRAFLLGILHASRSNPPFTPSSIALRATEHLRHRPLCRGRSPGRLRHMPLHPHTELLHLSLQRTQHPVLRQRARPRSARS